MKTATNFETGHKIKWFVSGSIRKGIFMQNLENGFCEVMVTEWDGKRRVIPANVPTEIIEFDK